MRLDARRARIQGYFYATAAAGFSSRPHIHNSLMLDGIKFAQYVVWSDTGGDAARVMLDREIREETPEFRVAIRVIAGHRPHAPSWVW